MIRVYRQTTYQPLVDFQSGSLLSEQDLDTAYRQSLFAAQEVRDNAVGTLTAKGDTGATGADGQDGDECGAIYFYSYDDGTPSL